MNKIYKKIINFQKKRLSYIKSFTGGCAAHYGITLKITHAPCHNVLHRAEL